MYKRKIVFENVQQYFVDTKNGVIIINESNKIIKAINPRTFEYIWQTDKYIGIDPFIDGVIVLVDNQYNGFYVNVENGKVNEDIDSKLKGYAFVNFYNSLGYYSLNSSTERKSGVYDFKNDTKLWEIKYLEGNKQILSATYFLHWDNNGEIGILSTQTGETIWETFISEIGSLNDGSLPNRVRRTLGLFMNVLVLHVSSNTIESLIGLDVQTGELLWQSGDFNYKIINYPYFPYDIHRVHANAENTRLIGINNGFIEINPLDGKVLKYIPITPLDAQGKFSEYNGIGFIPYDGKAQGKYIYFSACTREADGRAAILPSSIGIYNMDLQQVEWLYPFQEILNGKGGGALIADLSPIVDGNRLYASDLDKYLHIFEKEETQ